MFNGIPSSFEPLNKLFTIASDVLALSDIRSFQSLNSVVDKTLCLVNISKLGPAIATVMFGIGGGTIVIVSVVLSLTCWANQSFVPFSIAIGAGDVNLKIILWGAFLNVMSSNT